MGRAVSVVAAVLLVGTLAGCSDDDRFDRREERIRDALENNEEVGVTGSKAVWLVKESSMAPNDRTAVFFGYGDNYLACSEFAASYEGDYEDQYRCDSLD